MSDGKFDQPQGTKWDPEFTKRFMGIVRPFAKRYFRFEVRGLDSFPTIGGVLVVSNHSGGLMALDLPLFAADFYSRFGYDRPIYTLSHDLFFVGPAANIVRRAGMIRATRDSALKALRSGGVVMVFPGGDYDAYRPTLCGNVVDFNGHTGYIKTALEAGVRVVPVVSIGAQEGQFYLSRGTWLAESLGLRRRFRLEILPISIGFPFGLSVIIPPNFPLPTKIVTQVLEPIDVAAQFGDEPDIDEVDAHVRSVMQTALDRLAGQRRLPILG